MPTTCLTDLIFVPDGCTALPSGKTSLSQLPGFDINHADYLNDSQQLSGYEVMQDAVNRASDKIVSDFRSHMDIKGRFASIVDKGTIGFTMKTKLPMPLKLVNMRGLRYWLAITHTLNLT